MLDIHTACVLMSSSGVWLPGAGRAGQCLSNEKETGNPRKPNLGRGGLGPAARGKAILRANSVRAKIRLGPATQQTSQIRSGGGVH